MIRVDPATVATAPAPALIAGQLAMLTRLAEIGMEIAEEAGRQATGRAPQPAEVAPMGDPGLVYTRAARAVRMTIALQSRLMNDLAGLGRAEAAAREGRRRRLDRLVERACEAEHAEGDEACEGEDLGPLRWAARERLADAEIDAEIDGLPYAEVVARICGDLGLSPERTARIVAAAETDDASPAPPWLRGASADPLGGSPPLRPDAVGARPAARPRAPPA